MQILLQKAPLEDPAQFRAILDWAFENQERSERSRVAEASEPQMWGLELLLRFLGLAEDRAAEPKAARCRLRDVDMWYGRCI